MEKLSDLSVDDYCSHLKKSVAALRSEVQRFQMLEEDLLAVNDAVGKAIALAHDVIKSLGEIGQAAQLEIAAHQLHASRERLAKIRVEIAETSRQGQRGHVAAS